MYHFDSLICGNKARLKFLALEVPSASKNLIGNTVLFCLLGSRSAEPILSSNKIMVISLPKQYNETVEKAINNNDTHFS